MSKGRIYYGWLIVAFAFVILYAAYGVQYSFGIFLPEIEKALAPGQRAALSLGFAIYSTLYSALALVSGRMTDRWGPRPVVMLGGSLLGLGIILVSRSTTLGQFYIWYGLLAALGMSTVFVPATSTAVKWFMRRRGLAVGIVTMGGGVGQLTVPLLSSFLIAAWGWRTTYLIYGLGLALVLGLVGLLMKRDPESMGLKPYGMSTGTAKANTTAPAGEWALRPSEAVRTATFWLYTAALFVFWSVVFLPAVHLPSFARGALGASPSQAALTITALALGSASGRLAGGSISDSLGRRGTFVLLIGLQFLGFSGLLLSSLLKSLPLTYLSAILVGLGYGGGTALYPVFTGDLFGRLHAASIVGLIFSLAGGGAGLGVYLAGVIFQATGSYTGAFLMGAVLTLGSLPLILLVRPPRRRPFKRGHR